MLLVIRDKLTMKDAARYLLDGNSDRELCSGSSNLKTHSFEVFLVYFRQGRRQPAMRLHSPRYSHSSKYDLAFRYGTSHAVGQTVAWYDPFIFLARI
jgi:hypothetical protein